MKTFANAAARNAYSVPPEEAVGRVQFKQLDTREIYRAVRQGAGSQAWELAYSDESGGSGLLQDADYGDIQVSASGTNMRVKSAEQEFALEGVQTIAAFSDHQNDLAVSASASRVRVSAPFDANISGIAGGTSGRVLHVSNVGSRSVRLLRESGSSSAANRFAAESDFVLERDESATLIYDSTSNRWRIAHGVDPAKYQGLIDDDPVEYNPRLGLHATLFITATRRINFSTGTLLPGMRGTLRIVQDGTGGHDISDVSYGGVNGADIPGGSAEGIGALLSGGPNESEILGWFFDGFRLSIWNESVLPFYAYEEEEA